jgi:peptidoglycan/LPS O-acetylase OafA/YrhL
VETVSIEHPSRIPALDGVRGFAILMVMLFHFTWFGPFTAQAMQAGPVQKIGFMLALSGWMGVDLFFVLSGFLITGILLKTRAEPDYFRKFYLGRSLRIFPPYYLFLLSSIALLPFLPAAWKMDRSGYAWLATYLTNYQMGLHGWAAFALPFQHFWSLAIEEQFYLAWPCLVLISNDKWLRRTCVAIIVAALAYRARSITGEHNLVLAYTSTLGRSDELAAGALLALSVRKSGVDGISRQIHRIVIAVFSACLIAYFSVRPGLSSNDPLAILFMPLALMPLSTSVIALCLRGDYPGFLRGIFSLPLLRLLGRYSYSLYIVHQPVMITLVGVGAFDVVRDRFGHAMLWGLLSQYLLPSLISLALAMASWYLIEGRLMGLRRAISSAA